MAAEAKEAARQGRLKQLAVWERFAKGEDVQFVGQDGDPGYKCNKANLPPTPHQGGKIHFPSELLLLGAAQCGEIDEVQSFLRDGVSANCRDTDGMSPLHLACMENHLNVCSSLIVQGSANVNARDKDGWTALHCAVSFGNWRVANFLISNGASITIANSEHDLPIDLVSDAKVEGILQREMKRLEITEEKVQEIRDTLPDQMFSALQARHAAGDDLNSPLDLDTGCTALHIAACNGYLKAASFLLLQVGVDKNPKDRHGNTPFHLAAFFLQYQLVMLLATNGAEISAENRMLEKPIVMTEDATMIKLISALEKKLQAAAPILEGDPKSIRKRCSTINRSTRVKKDAHEAAKSDALRERKATPANYEQDHHQQPDHAIHRRATPSEMDDSGPA